MSRHTGYRRPSDVVRDGASMRLAAAMAAPHSIDWAAESDARYFRRRAREERNAADKAAGVEAREAHQELARLYAGLSEAGTDRWKRPVEARARAARRGPARSRKRQDALLDEALMGTFPASDPVSVAFIR
ncbi:hypothetical protein [Sphingosinicella rhizophila]|uniref:Uncharacterized protein n=1 Tax=Sphingosinicella rhizophila TaxID=3050082 RepID=A0ABU3QCC3_9SPHN|nr:hypothetical protein [Sphingosinicella sp. GR2756]MDT9601051.1 hypothetical protein [Sphingosinicella sp. GR2756]